MRPRGWWFKTFLTSSETPTSTATAETSQEVIYNSGINYSGDPKSEIEQLWNGPVLSTGPPFKKGYNQNTTSKCLVLECQIWDPHCTWLNVYIESWYIQVVIGGVLFSRMSPNR